MLRRFGTSQCPSCEKNLIQRYYSLDGKRSFVGAALGDDQRWACPSCDYSRPVIYAVERESVRRRGDLLRRTVRPLIGRSVDATHSRGLHSPLA